MCFPLDFIKTLLILAVVVVAIVAILNLLVPFILTKLGVALGEGWAVVVGAFRILLWAIIAIAAILICFQIIACLLSFSGGLHFPVH